MYSLVMQSCATLPHIVLPVYTNNLPHADVAGLQNAVFCLAPRDCIQLVAILRNLCQSPQYIIAAGKLGSAQIHQCPSN